jgi:hypothetical protein
MDINLQKEFFSYAYVRAVAAVAGFSVQEQDRRMDNAGIDLTITSPREAEVVLFPRCDAQVKCSWVINETENFIKYPLPVKNYNVLRNEKALPTAPVILIVVLVPREVTDWINISEEKIVMKKCGYWASLKGMPPTTNQETVTVELPRVNLLTPDNLTQIMKKIGKGEEL